MKQDRNETLSETELVEAARYGDRGAFEQLVINHRSRVWRIAWRILRHVEDAEDVTRETFLAAFRTLPAYQDELGFGAWLDRIVVGRSVKLLERVADLRRPPPAPSGAAVPLAGLDQGDAARRLAAARPRLSPSLRAVLVLHDAEHLPWEHVAHVLGLPVPAARQRLWRARTSLWRLVSGNKELPHEEHAGDELLPGYIDGELTVTERAAIERKLAQGGSFKVLHDELKALAALAANDPEPPVPDNLLDRLRAELPEPENGPRRKPRRPSAPAKPAGAVALGVGEKNEFPVGRVVAGLAVVAFIVAGGLFVVETRYGEQLWEKLRTRFTRGAAEPAAARPAEPPAPAVTKQPPAVTSDATTAPSGDATLAPAAPAPSGDATVSNAAPPADAVAAPATEATAPAPAAAPATPPEAAPAAAPPPAETAAPPPPGTCTNTWTLAPLATWGPAVPANPKLALGRVGVNLGGKALALPGDRVRITVPAGRWAALTAGLRGQGVRVPDGTPAQGADCAALIVDAPR